MKSSICNKIFEDVIKTYHKEDDVNAIISNPYNTKSIENLLYEKCWIDSVQWHLEDIIRNPNINPKIGLEIKHKIDTSNQKRTDIVEKIDDFYYEIFKNIKSSSKKINTESPGWIIDRLSILNLKEDLNTSMLIFNSLKMTLRKVKISVNKNCYNKCKR